MTSRLLLIGLFVLLAGCAPQYIVVNKEPTEQEQAESMCPPIRTYASGSIAMRERCLTEAVHAIRSGEYPAFHFTSDYPYYP